MACSYPATLFSFSSRTLLSSSILLSVSSRTVFALPSSSVVVTVVVAVEPCDACMGEEEILIEQYSSLYNSHSTSTSIQNHCSLYCHMGSHKLKVADSTLYTVTRASASGVILLISPYFLCDISHITPRGLSLLAGSPRQIMVTHPCEKTLNTWQHVQIWGIPSATPLEVDSFGYIPHIALAAM